MYVLIILAILMFSMSGCLGNGPKVKDFMSQNNENAKLIETFPGAKRDEIYLKISKNDNKFKEFMNYLKNTYVNDFSNFAVTTTKKDVLRCRKYIREITACGPGKNFQELQVCYQNPLLIKQIANCLHTNKIVNLTSGNEGITVIINDNNFFYHGTFSTQGRYFENTYHYTATNYFAVGFGIIIGDHEQVIFSVVDEREGTIRQKIQLAKELYFDKIIKKLNELGIDYELSSNSRFTLEKNGDKTYLGIDSFTY